MADCTLTARWVFPVTTMPLPGALVTINGGRIVHVGPAGIRKADIDLGNVAILPGFVNCHTHLDLSDVAGKCTPSPDFVAWLEMVIAHRRSQSPDDVKQAIATGIAQCLRHGTTLVGDITVGGKSWDQLASAPLRAVVFHEMIGLSAERADAARIAAFDWLGQHERTSTCTPALSPHAPYSVNAGLFSNVLSSNLGLPSRDSPGRVARGDATHRGTSRPVRRFSEACGRVGRIRANKQYE